MPLRNLMDLLQTSAAARSSRMLRDKNRMIPPRRLLPIVPGKRRRETLRNELRAMLHHLRDTPGFDIRTLASDEPELAPERSRSDAAEDFVELDHTNAN